MIKENNIQLETNRGKNDTLKSKFVQFYGDKEEGYSRMIINSQNKTEKDAYNVKSSIANTGLFFDASLKKSNKANLAAKQFHAWDDKPLNWTHDDLYKRVQQYVKAYSLLNVEEHTVDQVEIKGIGYLSQNQYDYTCMDLAGIIGGYTNVPLYDSFGSDALKFILETTRCSLVYVDGRDRQINTFIELVGKLGSSNPIKTAVFSLLTDEQRTKLNALENIKIMTCQELVDSSAACTANYESLVDTQKDLDKPVIIMYTSGSTGNPKGVCLTHRCVMSTLEILDPLAKQYCTDTLVYYDFLPVAHIMGRLLEYYVVLDGGVCCYWRGDARKILDELKSYAPNFCALVPRLLNRVYASMVQTISEKPGIVQSLLNCTTSSVESNYKSTGNCDPGCMGGILFKAFRAALGGNVKILITGSAPIKEEVLDFLKVKFGVNIIEGYGLTENCASASATNKFSTRSGNIGFVHSNCIVRLKDHRDLDFTSDDVSSNYVDGKRIWRGEICIKGGCLFKKYLDNPEANQESFEDGWFRTGDVGTLCEDGSLMITDRIKNIFKLQQGEYVAPEKVEKVSGSVRLIGQSFLTGESSESFTVMTVLPDVNACKKFLLALNKIKEDDIPDLKRYWAEYKDLIVEELEKGLKDCLKQSDLKPFEKPFYVTVTEKEMTVDNDCITPTFKVRRNFAKKFFADEIKNMYGDRKNPNYCILDLTKKEVK